MIDYLVSCWDGNAVAFVQGALGLTSLGVFLVLTSQSPIKRQRTSEAVIAGILLWVLLAPCAALFESSVETTTLTSERIVETIAIEDHASMPSSAWSAFDWLSSAYWIGFAAFSFYIAMAFVLLLRLTSSARPASGQLQQLAESLPLAGHSVRVLLTRHCRRPFCCGLLRPTIVLPVAVSRERPESLRSVLMHETAHLSQGDLRGRLLFALAMPILFWNPLYWWLRNSAQLCAELVADDIAAAHLDKATYVRELIELAERSPTSCDRNAVRMAAIGKESEFCRRMKMLIQRQSPIATRCSKGHTAVRRAAVLSLVILAACSWSAVQPTDAQQPAEPNPAPNYESRIVHKEDVASELAPRVYFAFENADVSKVLDTIARVSGRKIHIDKGIEGKVSLRLMNVPWQNAMVEAANQVGGIVLRESGNNYRVTKRSD